mmetsp:Transcript_71188/g.123552  ORF Transcript_71188/g.123552 Transcript_71188/m.123552 type:complete len:244 (-) Transcript_71188:2041-2772(-)
MPGKTCMLWTEERFRIKCQHSAPRVRELVSVEGFVFMAFGDFCKCVLEFNWVLAFGHDRKTGRHTMEEFHPRKPSTCRWTSAQNMHVIREDLLVILLHRRLQPAAQMQSMNKCILCCGTVTRQRAGGCQIVPQHCVIGVGLCDHSEDLFGMAIIARMEERIAKCIDLVWWACLQSCMKYYMIQYACTLLKPLRADQCKAVIPKDGHMLRSSKLRPIPGPKPSETLQGPTIQGLCKPPLCTNTI